MRDPQEYREILYRMRQHPRGRGVHANEADEDDGVFKDDRNSFGTVYSSLAAFLAIEWIARRYWYSYPHGIVFPVGFLLFWAFYYTYYKPDSLEAHLTEPSRWNLRGIGAVCIGVAIWFVKVTVIEMAQLLLLLPRAARRPLARRRQAAPARPAPAAPPPMPERKNPQQQQATRVFVLDDEGRPRVVALPREVLVALTALGLDARCKWPEIHRRYRELAKKFHPDLAGPDTLQGRRFLQVDAAFRKLLAVRSQYFPDQSTTAERAINS